MQAKFWSVPGILLLFAVHVFAEAPKSEAVVDMIRQWDGGTPALRQTMIETVRKHDDAKRWSGVTDELVYGISVVSFTREDKEDNHVRLIRGTAHLVAAREMLFAKVLLDRYKAFGMDDPQLLRAALLRVLETLAVQARLDYREKTTIVEDYRIVGIVTAERKKIAVVMGEPDNVEAVKTAYAEELHHLAGLCLDRGKYEDALRALHSIRKFGTPGRAVGVDVVRAFLGLDRLDDAEKIVGNLTVNRHDDLPLHLALYEAASHEKTASALALLQRLNVEIVQLTQPEFDLREFLHPQLSID